MYVYLSATKYHSAENETYMEKRMPNDNVIATVEIEDYDEEVAEYGKDDFGFILGPDGELKSFMIPEHLMEDPPEEVKMIFELFGIDDIHELNRRTLH